MKPPFPGKVVALAAVLLAMACASSSASEDCGEGRRVDTGGATYCVFERPITETGFRCPDFAPHAYDVEDWRVCAEEDDLKLRDLWEILMEAEARPAPTSRQVVAGTDGFCHAPGQVDDSCETAADCHGFRGANPPHCPGFPLAATSGCFFANATWWAWAGITDCEADLSCIDVPRACVAGRCVNAYPDAVCASDDECRLVDTGCACIAAGVDHDTPLRVGRDCDGVGCAPSAEARCVDGKCAVGGAWLEDYGQHVCGLFAEAEPETDVEACVDAHAEDDWAGAASYWPLLKSSLFATTFDGLLSGPWSGQGRHLCP